MDRCDYCNIMPLSLKPVVVIDELQDLKWIYNWANADVNKLNGQKICGDCVPALKHTAFLLRRHWDIQKQRAEEAARALEVQYKPVFKPVQVEQVRGSGAHIQLTPITTEEHEETLSIEAGDLYCGEHDMTFLNVSEMKDHFIAVHDVGAGSGSSGAVGDSSGAKKKRYPVPFLECPESNCKQDVKMQDLPKHMNTKHPDSSTKEILCVCGKKHTNTTGRCERTVGVSKKKKRRAM